eukprot:4527404-Karenia_brevis.AAC.1
MVHYVDPLKQGECIAKSHNPLKSKFRNNPDFDDLPENNGSEQNEGSSASDTDNDEELREGQGLPEDFIERE